MEEAEWHHLETALPSSAIRGEILPRKRTVELYQLLSQARAATESLGAAAPFYSSRANARDMDAIRAALGIDRVAIYGISYGTNPAVATQYEMLHAGG